MAQPFWAIALLGVTGLQARDIMGYSMAIMLMSGLIFYFGSDIFAGLRRYYYERVDYKKRT